MVDAVNVGAISAQVVLTNGIDLVAIGNSLTSAENSVKTSADRMAGYMEAIPQRMAYSIARAGAALTIGITAPILLIAKASLTVAESFESNMNRVQAATGATGDQIKALGIYADQLGVKMGIVPTQLSEGMYIAAQAGMTVNDIYSQMPTVLELSRVGAVGVNDAVRLLTSTMTDFGFKGSEGAQKVGNMMALAVNKSLAEMPDLIASMRYAAPLASELNIRFEELMGTFKVLADHNIRASQAGTGLNEMMSRMLNPTKKATEALAGYGLTVSDINPRLHTLAEIFDKLNSKKVNPEALQLIFGVRGGRAAAFLEQAGGTGIASATKDMSSSQGTLDKMYETVNQGFPGAVRRFSAELQVFEKTLGDILKRDLVPFIDKLTELMHKFEGLSPSMQDTIVKFALYAAVIGPVILVIGKVMQVVQGLGATFNLFAKYGKDLIGVFVDLAGVLGTAGDLGVVGILDTLSEAVLAIIGTITGVVGVVGILGVAVVAITAVIADAAYKTGYLGKGFEILKDIVVIVVNTLVNVAIKLYEGFNKAVDAIIKLGQTIYEKVPGAKQIIDALNGSLDGLVKTLDSLANQSAPDWGSIFPPASAAENNKNEIAKIQAAVDSANKTQQTQYSYNEPSESSDDSKKKLYTNKPAGESDADWMAYRTALENQNINNGTTFEAGSSSGSSKSSSSNDDALKASYQRMYGDKWETAYNADHPGGVGTSSGPDFKYSVDQYKQLKEVITENVKTIRQDEVAAYQAAAKAAGDTASFTVNADGTVQASMQKTITLLATEEGKYQDALKAAQDSGFTRNVENTMDAMKNLTSKSEDIQTTYKNGAKIITDTVTTAVKDSLGKIINYTKDVTQTIDDGVNHVVNKTSSAFQNTNNRAIENTIDAYGNLKQVVTDTAESVKNGVDTITTKVTTNLYDANRSLISSTANVTQEMKDGTNSIKTTYDDITNAYSALTNKVSNTYKSASGQLITEEYYTNAKNVSSAVPKTPNVSASVPNTPGQAAVMTSDSAKDLTSSLSNINNISFKNFISNLSAAEKILSNMAALSKQVNSNLSFKGVGGGGATVNNNSSCVKISQYNDYGSKNNAKQYWSARMSKT